MLPLRGVRESRDFSRVEVSKFSISNMFFDIFKITVKYEKLGKFVDSFLLGFLVLLLVFNVSCFVLKVNGVIKFNSAYFCDLCRMLSVVTRIISRAVLGEKTEN